MPATKGHPQVRNFSHRIVPPDEDGSKVAFARTAIEQAHRFGQANPIVMWSLTIQGVRFDTVKPTTTVAVLAPLPLHDNNGPTIGILAMMRDED